MVLNGSAPADAAPVLPHSTTTAADMTNSLAGIVRNWDLNVVSRFWKPLTTGPPGGLTCVQAEPKETPKVLVIRFEYSAEMSVSLAEGSSPFLKRDTVGIESSSATHGSSTPSVAGKKRPPTKQWARAPEMGTDVMKLASASVSPTRAARIVRVDMGSLR